MTGLVVAGVVAGAVAGGAPAAGADAIAGATYTGVASDGANVTFTVSADGTLVDSYDITGVHGDTCQYIAEGDFGVWPGAPITGGAFAYTLYDAILFQGTFAGAQSAAGTFHLYNHAMPPIAACDTGTVSWTATTTATPPPGGGGGGSGGGSGSGSGGKPHRFATRVTLRKRSSTTYSGRLLSSQSACRARRKVTLWRGSHRIASTRSKASGKFSFLLSSHRRGRRVRATVKEQKVAAGLCAAGSSTFIAG